MRKPHGRTPRVLAVLVLLALLGTSAVGTPSDAVATVSARHARHAKHASPPAQVLSLINAARATARTCGGRRYRAVPPLKNDARLQGAAQRFATEMGVRDFFSHVAPNGSTPGERISAAGYRWRAYGENILGGLATPAATVAAWLKSVDHCRNIMSPFHNAGIGFAHVPGSLYGSYWVMDLASH